MFNVDKMSFTTDLDCVDDELFTELTPEEGAVVEGGATLQLRYLFPNGTPIEDDPLIMVGTSTKYSASNVTTTQDLFINVPFSGDTTLSLWDQDGSPENSDLLGSVKITSAPKGVTFLNTTDYDLTYQILA